jgi:hypothetical protein
MPRVKQEERFFKNAQTWKQVSTNVPPEVLKALKQQVTKEYTMSHVIRDLISESDIMRGGLPQPQWSKSLLSELAALRAEVADLKEMLAVLQPPAVAPEEASPEEAPALLAVVEPVDEPTVIQPEKERQPSLIGRLTQMLAVVRKTA